MQSEPPDLRETTQLFVEWRKGDQQALQELMQRIYDELRRLAARLLSRDQAGHTLQPTALVHEYLRVVGQTRVGWQNLRRVLADHARAKLDEALSELAQLDPQQSRIVEIRFFAGGSIEETAASLGISPATVKRDLAVARAWLYRRLTQS